MRGNRLRERKNRLFPQLTRTLILLTAYLSLSSCQSPSTSISKTRETGASTSSSSTKAIVLGDISNDPTAKIARYQPLADYLARRLREFKIGSGEVKVAPNVSTMSNWLKSGQVDLYFDSLYPAMLVSDSSGAQPILRRWKDGQAEYYGVFFALKSSGIKTLAELQGQTIALDDIHSTSGYLLPLVKLIESGFQPVAQTSPRGQVAPAQIGYVFSKDDENTIQWVISGKVKAGVVDIGSFREIPLATHQEINILAKTVTVARQVVMMRADLEPQLGEAIKTVLLKMNQTDEGKEVLAKFEKTAKFDDFPPENKLDTLRQLHKLISQP